jgi:mannose-6-phosphate isomerase
MNVELKPFKFVPYLKTVLWGGDRIASYKRIATDKHNIGESWEISGVEGHESIVSEGPDKGSTLSAIIRKYRGDLVGKSVYERFGDKFPLLIKIIDAKRDLSLQVHPDDELAMKRHNSFGKTEMWYIIDSAQGASIYTGFSRKITPEEYERRIADDTLMNVVACHKSHPGDVFFLPSGRIHCIGAGNLLAEIQQTSDITYRVYDFNRLGADGKPRELHTAQARDAIDYNLYDNYVQPYGYSDVGDTPMIKCKYFDVHKVVVNGVLDIDHSGIDSFCVVMCLKGTAEISDHSLSVISINQGETVLIPANVSLLHFEGKAELITAVID